MSEGAAAPAAPAGGDTGAPAPQGQPAQAAKPGETPAQAEARRLKLRIGGQEQEFDESEVIANFQKGRNSAQMLTKAQQVKEQALKAKMEAEGILGKLKDKGNIRSVLQELGYTREELRAMSERDILDAIEEEKLSPAERRAKDLERQLAERDKEKQAQEKEKQEAAYKEEVARHKDEVAGLFMETMEATGLPKSSGRFVMHRMAQLYMQNEEAGLESTPEEMAAHVMAGLQQEHRGVLSGLEGESLMTYLGPEVVKKVLAANLAKVRAGKSGGAAPVQQRNTAPAPKATVDPRRGRWAMIDELIGK